MNHILSIALALLVGCSAQYEFHGPGHAKDPPALASAAVPLVRASGFAQTPLTSWPASAPLELGGAQGGSFYANADRIDITVVMTSGAATFKLIYYNPGTSIWEPVDTAGWLVDSADTVNSPNKTRTARIIARKQGLYYQVYKASGAGTIASCSLEIAYNGSTVAALSSLEPAASVAPSGTAGGALAGTYPNPTLASGVAISSPALSGTSTGAGLIALANGGTGQSNVSIAQNAVWAGPGSGGAGTPTYRALVSADLPAVAGVAGNYPTAGQIPTFTVDAYGRITNASTTTTLTSPQIASPTMTGTVTVPAPTPATTNASTAVYAEAQKTGSLVVLASFNQGGTWVVNQYCGPYGMTEGSGAAATDVVAQSFSVAGTLKNFYVTTQQTNAAIVTYTVHRAPKGGAFAATSVAIAVPALDKETLYSTNSIAVAAGDRVVVQIDTAFLFPGANITAQFVPST